MRRSHRAIYHAGVSGSDGDNIDALEKIGGAGHDHLSKGRQAVGRGLHNHRNCYFVIDITTIVRRYCNRDQTPALPSTHHSRDDPGLVVTRRTIPAAPALNNVTPVF